MTRVLSLVLAVGLLLPASSSASLAASPPLPRAEPEEHDLAKRFQLYTSIAEANPSAATTTTTASLSLATAGSKKLLTPPAPRANLPKTLNYGVWENVEALKDPGRGNGDISVPQKGNFLGLSIELSVANQVLGPASKELRAPLLNYLMNLRSRTMSGPRMRIGGNSQEGSILYPVNELPNGGAGGSFLEKAESVQQTKTNTPDVLYTEDMIYAMGNISALTNAEWLMGLPFKNDSLSGWENSMYIADFVEKHLGSSLSGFQLGNEPDLYAGRRRSENYTEDIWLGEMQTYLANVDQVDSSAPQKNNFYIPSICCNWVPMDFLNDTNFLDQLGSRMNTMAFEHYPLDNCNEKASTYPQEIMAQFLGHELALTTVAQYVEIANVGISRGLDVALTETNTGSCSGFVGLSDSFAASLWILDWTLTLAAHNFTSALLHVGGRDAFYNPFTVVPTDMSTYRDWTTGSVYYSLLAMSELMGPSNTSRIVDLSNSTGQQWEAGNPYPAYAVYENDVPSKLAFFNMETDESGGAAYTASFKIGGVSEGSATTTPGQVFVRYLLADSTAEMYNITWAGQIAGSGGEYSSDGTLEGTVETVTITCDNGLCNIPMQAPSFALVFLTQDAVNAVSGVIEAKVPGFDWGSATTYATTYHAGGQGTATVDQVVLATSNGRGGKGTPDGGSTSKGSTESETESRNSAPAGVRFASLAVVGLAVGAAGAAMLFV